MWPIEGSSADAIGPEPGEDVVGDIPLWFRLAVLTVLVLLLVGIFVADWTVDGYDAAPTELALIGVIGAAVGLDQLRRGGGNGHRK